MSLEIQERSIGANAGEQLLRLPAGATLLGVTTAGHHLVLRMLVDPDALNTPRLLTVVYSNSKLTFDPAQARYIGSGGAYDMRHVFELPQADTP